MKKDINILLRLLLMTLAFAGSQTSFAEAYPPLQGTLLAQADEEDFFTDEEENEEEDAEAVKKRQEEEARKRAEEERKKKAAEEQAKRVAIKKRQLKERKKQEAQLKEIDALRESSADSTEYTITPGSVEMVVELDPNNYGFRQRNHRMTLGGEFDVILRGRAMLQYDFRFFEYLSLALQAGVDWTDLSVYSRFRDQLSKPVPKQFSALGGLSARWRVTEWYMRSAIFLEPSLVGGYLWQTYVTQKTNHWLLRPGLFVGTQTVFDSGFAVSFRVGAEVPLDFGTKNPFTELVDPLLMVGFGLAI